MKYVLVILTLSSSGGQQQQRIPNFPTLSACESAASSYRTNNSTQYGRQTSTYCEQQIGAYND